MSQKSIPDSTSTLLIDVDTDKPSKGLWIQNFSTTVAFKLSPYSPGSVGASSAGANDFYLAPASAATSPTTLVLDTPSLVTCAWYAYQSSGGAVNLNYGRW